MCGSNYTNTYNLDLFIYMSFCGSLFIHNKPMISLVISKVKNNENVKQKKFKLTFSQGR